MNKFEERLEDYKTFIDKKETFVDKMQSMDFPMRSMIALDLQAITKASLWSILNSWSRGRTEPLQMQKDAIAEYFGCTSEKLFPKKVG